MKRPYDVYAMCNPLFDLQAEVSDEFVRELGYEKGGMYLIDHDTQRKIVPSLYESIVNAEPGGSGANTAIGVATFGGSVCYTGHVGRDEHGAQYRAGLGERGVKPNLGESDGVTGVCLVLVTPDAQRTMFTFLGQCQALSEVDVNLDDLAASEYFYLTAYLWDTESQKRTVLTALNHAKLHGVKVALSLSDPFCVARHRQELLDLVEEHVDILIGNADEAMAFTQTESSADAATALGAFCRIAVVTDGADGSLIFHDGQLDRFPAKSLTPVDTTGAGDAFAAGILYGLSRDWKIADIGALATAAATNVISRLGPRLIAGDCEFELDLIEVGG